MKASSQRTTKRRYPLRSLYFYLTDGCNLHCRHCWIDPKFQEGGDVSTYLDFEIFKSIIEQALALGLSGVKLTGGEPFLHPESYEIIELIKRQGLRLAIETNGLLCGEKLAKKIKECKKSFVSVSLDGACAETHEWVRGVAGSFGKALEGIKNLVNAGIRPQIIMAVMRRNKDEIEDVIQLAKGLGCGSVKFNIVQPIAKGERLHDAGEVLSIEELTVLGEWIENTLIPATTLPLYFSHPPAFSPLGRLFGDKVSGCGVCGIFNILGVLADGAYALCGIGETVPELVFGRAREDRLEDVWNNTTILKELREGLPRRLEGACGECIMKGRCLGSCVAQNYYRSKSLFAGFWYCEAARNKGLFPKTRLMPKACVEI